MAAKSIEAGWPALMTRPSRSRTYAVGMEFTRKALGGRGFPAAGPGPGISGSGPFLLGHVLGGIGHGIVDTDGDNFHPVLPVGVRILEVLQFFHRLLTRAAVAGPELKDDDLPAGGGERLA